MDYLEYLGADLVNEYRHRFGNTVEKSDGWDVPEEAKQMMGEISDKKVAENHDVSDATVNRHRNRLNIDPAYQPAKGYDIPKGCIEQLGEEKDETLAERYGVGVRLVKHHRQKREISSFNSSS